MTSAGAPELRPGGHQERRHAVVLAGGRGTRLRPYTIVLPKPLLPIGDELPVLEITLRQLAAQGFGRVTLAIGHHAELIRTFAGTGDRWGLELDYAGEDEPLGTVGPLLPLLDRLPERFVVMNGDVLTDLDYAALLDHHAGHGAPLTVATHHTKTRIDFGVVESQDSRMVAFREKPVLTHEVNMGVYALSRSALLPYESGLSMGFDDLIDDLIAAGDPPCTFPWGGYWLDIGRPEDYERANAEFGTARRRLLPEADGSMADLSV